MSKISRNKAKTNRNGVTKYDAHHSVLDKTYGAFADLRRQLSDSREAVEERNELLQAFSKCPDSQRTWLVLEDYFERLNLSRKDFQDTSWWDRVLSAQGRTRIEELAMLFMRARRPLPTELEPYANLARFAEMEKEEEEQELLDALSGWLFPSERRHLDAPRASLKVRGQALESLQNPGTYDLSVDLFVVRPRSGEKQRSLLEVVEIVQRSSHEEELFTPEDWRFILWLAENYPDGRTHNQQDPVQEDDLDEDEEDLVAEDDSDDEDSDDDFSSDADSETSSDDDDNSDNVDEDEEVEEEEEIIPSIRLSGSELLNWLAQWGHTGQIQFLNDEEQEIPIVFKGEVAQLEPSLETRNDELLLSQSLKIDGEEGLIPFQRVTFFDRSPRLASVNGHFYLLRNAPPSSLFQVWKTRKSASVKRMRDGFLKNLRKNYGSRGEVWKELCDAHSAKPKFTFELEDDTIRLRLMADSEMDSSSWEWNGHEWKRQEIVTNARTGRKKAVTTAKPSDKPQILDDPRLDAATTWLSRLDWFTPEPGLWVGDANENFLNELAAAWDDRPEEAEYLGDPGFQRLFLSPRRLKPKLKLQPGSGIDWFSVSAEWEIEGMRLTPKDLERLQTATSRFVKLPDSGWVELDFKAAIQAHETMADLGVDGLSPIPKKVTMTQAKALSSETIDKLGSGKIVEELKERLDKFEGLPRVPTPEEVKAELRPYQEEGFHFLCHMTAQKAGAILADDMGLGKTLQTLTWLCWLKKESEKKGNTDPFLVICPASVLHNWRREAERFVPHFKTLTLESGSARHNLRKKIPQHDLIITNYSLLRRDLTALKKFSFQAVILDEAQFIKNPSAQVTQSVKQLESGLRIALTGTPLENRLLDLWSIVDFVQPGYLGKQEDFNQRHDPKGPDAEVRARIARKQLSARLRPILLRRLKKQVAKDLPDRIEERRDCELTEEQRKLYLAELRRSREKVFQSIKSRGLEKSRIHVLAALTRLRQICCHPRLVGSDTASGKTETLFEILEPILAEGHKALVFSQFVQMLKLLEKECIERGLPTYILTGETKNRQGVVSEFQEDPNASIFLLSLRAAGTGLNLTTASYVALYDPWWNPAVEAQAIDRSHRIGQTRTVNAYRLITPGTVEEKIWNLQQKKAQTIVDVLGEEAFTQNLSANDLDYLFSEEDEDTAN